MDEYPAKGPLGSVDRRCPVDVQKLYDELHAGNSSQVESWRDDNIREWSKSLGQVCDDARVARVGCGYSPPLFLGGYFHQLGYTRGNPVLG